MKYIFTDLYEEFTCVGSACIDTCCKEWTILIDEDTYGKYSALEEPLRSRICSHISQFGCGKWKGQRKIDLDSDGRCPFLNQQNLCDIYSMVSPEAMSEVCQTYPRKIVQHYDVVMATLMLSCPEAARLVIEKKDPVMFSFYEKQESGQEIENADWTLYNELINGLVIATDILQDRDLPLWQRFQLLLVETAIVQEHIEKQELATLRGEIECLREKEYRQKLYGGSRSNPLEGIKKWEVIYSIVETIIMQLSGVDGVLLKFKAMLEKLSSLGQDAEQTYRLWNREYKSLELDTEYENMAVNCIFEYYMDALAGKSLYVNVTKMLILLILVRAFEVVDYHRNGELTVEDRALTMANVFKVMEHTSTLLDRLAEKIVDSNDGMELIQLICIFD